MSKQRIYEYAKELNIKSKDIIDELKKMNVEVSNHMQALAYDLKPQRSFSLIHL